MLKEDIAANKVSSRSQVESFHLCRPVGQLGQVVKFEAYF